MMKYCLITALLTAGAWTTGCNKTSSLELAETGQPDLIEPGGSATQNTQRLFMGGNHQCVRGSSGHLFCWGENRQYQTGTGISERGPVSAPMSVVDLGVVEYADSGQRYSCATQQPDGGLYCWGATVLGNMGPHISGESCGIRRCQPTPKALNIKIKDIKQVRVGGWLTCVIDGAHQVWCWGSNYSGQLSRPANEEGNPVPTRIAGLPGPAGKVVLGAAHVCALVDGDVYCWGQNLRGQLGDGTFEDRHTPQRVDIPEPVVDVDSKSLHTCALTQTKVLYCWGQNAHGEIGISPEQDKLMPSPQLVNGLDDIDGIATGVYTTCALKNGQLLCWGANRNGTLGDGTRVSRHTPAPVQGLEDVVEVDLGASINCALTKQDKLFCWGEHEWIKDEQPGHLTPVEIVLPNSKRTE